MSGVDQHAEAHRLRAELGWGARRVATELGISRHAAAKLLTRPLAEAAAPVAEVAERPRRPVAEVAAPVAARVASHLDVMVGQAPPPPRHMVVVDLKRFPGLAEDLALLEETGAYAAEVINYAVGRLAGAVRTARERGVLREGQRWELTHMWLRPADRPAA
ncbi:hypothetical protein [Streptomyces sp. bgisy027]|uniref:hypothetical protein n=1 Tax=Streptomyces sp. bgisy027 TaxID=3413770 RepID=UPI003D7330E7